MTKVSPTACGVLVADGRRARLFMLDFASSCLDEFKTLTNPEARLHESEFHSDRQGRTFDSGAPGRHAKEASGGKAHSVDSFAREVADELKAGRVDNRFSDLVIVAAPRFMGSLRQHLDDPTAKLVREEIPKEVTGEAADKLFTLVSGIVAPRYPGSPEETS